MAGKEQGLNVLLYVGDSQSPTTYSILKGQRQTQIQLTGQQIDTADKTSGGWATSMQGLKSATVTAQGLVDWPDTTGFAAIRAAFTAGTTIQCKLVLDTAGKYIAGTFAVTQCSISGAHDGATEYDIQLQPTQALTYVDA